MKLRFLYILSIFCLLFTACSEEKIVVLSQTEFVDIPCEGGTYEFELNTNAEWTATSLNDWCTVAETSGVGSAKVRVVVEGNIRAARTGEVIVYSNGERQVVYFRQKGLEGDELVYKIPIIFHVIYNNPSDKNQNPDAKDIYDILDNVNKFYRNAMGTSQDIKLEFVAAQFDPKGNELAEAGIERIQWPSATLDPEDVMGDETNKYTHFLWEPNDYVNVLLYNFTPTGDGYSILGISTFPYTTKAHALDGTEVLDDMNITLENLKYVRGVSINSSYIYNSDDQLVQMGRVPAEWCDIMNLQNNTYITLAHELGHYFGLRHVFSESETGLADTDYCTDTKSYDKQTYDQNVSYQLNLLYQSADYASQFDWSSLFSRTDLDGEKFDSHNIMDYAYCHLDEFTPQQRERMRHVLLYSPMIPGPKDTRDVLSRGGTPEGRLDLPFSYSTGCPTRIVK